MRSAVLLIRLRTFALPPASPVPGARPHTARASVASSMRGQSSWLEQRHERRLGFIREDAGARVGLQVPEPPLAKDLFLCLCACGERGNVRAMKSVAAHFDGKQIVLEEPVKLTAHTKLKVLVAEEGETFSGDDLTRWLSRLSEPAFAKVWDNNRDAEYDKL
jgi:hypothetical protein